MLFQFHAMLNRQALQGPKYRVQHDWLLWKPDNDLQQGQFEMKDSSIKVLIRKRPLLKKEQHKGEKDIITVENNCTVLVHEHRVKVDLTPFVEQYRYNFDGAFGQSATNEQIYVSSIRPLIDNAFDGARVSCFAYGQTGSGKTYTMLGDQENGVAGLFVLAGFDIFQKLDASMTVWVAFYEIYCGKLYDLLNDRNILYAREDAKSNVNIVGLSERKIVSVENLVELINYGLAGRVTAQNSTNLDSSRSHALLQIVLRKNNKAHGKISFIDLAGSERAADHAYQIEKQTRIDGAEINKSLLALKQCIRALDQNKFHTPFRGSKLTMVLKDSFTGYCRTIMIGNISPNSLSCQNTLNTLKYADRVKELKKPNKNFQNDLEGLQALSKELLLPRQLVQSMYKNTQIKRDNFMPSSQSLEKRKGETETQKKIEGDNKRKSDSDIKKKYETHKRQGQSSGRKNSPSPRKRQSPSSRLYFNQNKAHKGANIGSSQQGIPSGLDSLRKMEARQRDLQECSFEVLSRCHEDSIQQVLESQEQLMKMHEKHINGSIEWAKQEMHLMNEADKIGSDIEDYLNSLEAVLNQEMASINGLMNHVKVMKKDLSDSKQVQQVYLQRSKTEYGDATNSDDDHLFS